MNVANHHCLGRWQGLLSCDIWVVGPIVTRTFAGFQSVANFSGLLRLCCCGRELLFVFKMTLDGLVVWSRRCVQW